MKNDYTSLDQAVLKAVQCGASTFRAISLNDAVWGISGRFNTELPWRVVDRRLQTLRKADKLHYSRKLGWRYVNG